MPLKIGFGVVSVFTAVLWSATALAALSRVDRWRWRIPVLLIGALPLLVAIGLCVLAAVAILHQMGPRWLIAASLGWVILYIVGIAVVRRRWRTTSSDTMSAPVGQVRPRRVGAMLVLGLGLTVGAHELMVAEARSSLTGIRDEALESMRAEIPDTQRRQERGEAFHRELLKDLPDFEDMRHDLYRDRLHLLTEDRGGPPDVNFLLTMEEAQILLAAHARTLDALRQRPSLPAPWIEEMDGFLTRSRRLLIPGVGSATHLLQLAALVRASTGDPTGALDDLDVIRHLADELGRGTPIDRMLSAAVLDVAARAIPDVIALTPPDVPLHGPGLSAAAARVRQEIWRAELDPDGVRVQMLLRGEIGGGRRRRSADPTTPWGRLYLALAGVDDLRVLDRWARGDARLTRAPHYESAREYEDLRTARLESWPGLLLCHFKYDWSGGLYVSKMAARTETRAGLAELALAASRFRARTGKWPQRLTDLVPSELEVAPTDPFCGRPLQLEPEEGGLILYGVGEDGRDDGGLPAAVGDEPGDASVRLGGPPRRDFFLDPDRVPGD